MNLNSISVYRKIFKYDSSEVKRMITKDMGIMEMVQKYPKAGQLLMAAGLG